MTKKYLCDYDVIRACYDNNANFESYVWNECDAHNMDCCEDDIREYNLKGLEKVIDRSWFFYTIENRDEFLKSVLATEYPYMFFSECDEDNEKAFIKNLLDASEFSWYTSETNESKLDEILDNIANEFVDKWNRHLKEYYCNVDDEMIDCYLSNIGVDNFANYYIIDDDYDEIYEDVNRVIRF